MRLFLLLALAGAQLPSPADTPLPATPPLLRERFVRDIQAKNLDDLLSLYTPDAEHISPDAPPTSGLAALRNFYAGNFSKSDETITLDRPAHHDEGGDPRHPAAIIETGRYTEATRDLATHATTHTCGAYTFRYVKNPEGGWLIAHMEWTTEPCPATPR